MLYLTKKMSFSASHRLFNPTLSDSENEKIYDKCNNLNGHGHNYTLEVTVKGIPDPKTGYLIDLKKMKSIIDTEIIDKVDHKNLNLDVDFLKGYIPTVENLAVLFWNILKDCFYNCKLHEIKIYETENSSVAYFGEPVDLHKY